MILIDTSVWIEAFRRGDGTEANHVRSLLDADVVVLAAPVRIEILVGASKRDRASLRRVLSALPVIFPGPESWARIDGWIDVAAARGERFGFADLLIASLAADGGHEIWSLDDDFRRMARIGLVKRHDPAVWKPG